jgi:hypothetical protein
MRHAKIIAPALAALIVAGCDARDDTEIVTPADEVGIGVEDDDAYPVGGTMTPEQQGNFEEFDRDAAMSEYETNRSAMTASDMNGQAMSGGNGAMSETTQADASAGATGSAATPAPSLRPRSQMDFAFLDRNSDGQLSVGEYAIWAVRANPATSAPNDQTRPFISTEHLNEAGQTFFYFDENADSYLSRSEFDTARSSARTP